MNLEQIAAPSWAEFNEWMHKELPAGTIIGNPGWWASRIYKRFFAAPPICPTAEGQLILGKNYEAGLWSRRNYEAMLEDQLAAAPEYKKP